MKTLNVWISDHEKDFFTSRARALELTQSAFLRRLIHREEEACRAEVLARSASGSGADRRGDSSASAKKSQPEAIAPEPKTTAQKMKFDLKESA